jgi:maltooligosyltrehalose trehalohydrolase
VKVTYDEQKRWLVMDRGLVKVACNLGDQPVELENPEHHAIVLASRSGILSRRGRVVLPPDSMAILSGEKG